MDYENILRDWLLGLIAALLAALVLAEMGTQFLEPVLAPFANLLALVTFLAFILVTGAFLVYTASFTD
ncbi:MAG: hypothetical protein V5A38_07635 [Halolamina sp.]|uniref:hypothetical protein n=1 Tax=Halolamina sp. TaxID=1940283 RepID=UPI002FC2D452